MATTPTILFCAGIFGGWELILFAAIVLILFGVRKLPELLKGLRKGIDEFRKATREANREMAHTLGMEFKNPDDRKPSRSDEFVLWIAQGFDVGRIPWAPGTFGTLVGLLWFAALLVPGSLLIYLAGIAVSIAVSVFVCTEAERILGETDPGSVVLDEIIAMPICFLPWVAREYLRMGALPSAEMFFTGNAIVASAGIFLLFRVFDIAKPWPVRQSPRDWASPWTIAWQQDTSRW
jgi:phosphatidylglycerophosphatase A